MMISTSPASSVAQTAAVDWQATRQQTALATQLLDDPDDHPAPRRDIGRQTGPNERELFVSCAPDLALQQQFEHLEPEFIAVHDLGTTASRKLLVGLGAASKRGVQRLSIRRQGFGNVLAVLEFVELPTEDGGTLRLYSTAADADTAARHGLARVLLGASRLAVALVGDLPGHAIAALLQPLRDAIDSSSWQNRELLLLPLSAGSQLATHCKELGRGSGLNVQVTPQVHRPADVWGYINATWARMSQAAPGGASALSRLESRPAAPTDARAATPAAYPLPIDRATMRPMPAVGAATSLPANAAIDRYLRQVGTLAGVTSGCVFEIDSANCAAIHGGMPSPRDLARQGSSMMAAVVAAGRSLGIEPAPVDVAVTLGSHHLVLRALPGHPRLALHVALDKATANLTLARLQIQRLDPLLGTAPH